MQKFKSNKVLKNIIKKFKLIYKEEGWKSAVSYCINYVLAKMGWFHDQWLFGRLVEIFGNKVWLNGCTFSLDNPLIPTAFKCRFILGRYETKERQTILHFLNPLLPVVEFGASIGVVSCITNKKIQNPKNHVVVEADPSLIPLLEVNRDVNNCSFIIINKVSGYDSKEMTFYINKRFSNGSTQRVTDKPISIAAVTLEEILTDYKFQYANLICDIEGGEIDLIKNEIHILSKKIFQIIMEVHPSIVGVEKISNMFNELKTVGFQQIHTHVYGGINYGNVLLFENKNLKKILYKK